MSHSLSIHQSINSDSYEYFFNFLFFFKCAKLLGDVSVMQFYPSKFVLVTDILDNFGKYICLMISLVR